MTDDETEAGDRGKDLETTLCNDGRHVNVRNPLSGSGGIHTVELDAFGVPTGCTCRGWTYNQTCYHVDHVRASPLLLSSARAAAADVTPQVATDGGREQSADDDRFRLPEDPEHVEEPEHDAEAGDDDDEQHYAGGTAENTMTDIDGDEVPKRSERPDMGGGETTGVVDL